MLEEKTQDIEEIDEDGTIITPFDPTKIKVRAQPLTIGHIIDMLEHDEININTEFQRLPNLWSDLKKSRLIESIILNLPIPTFYFDGHDDDH